MNYQCKTYSIHRQRDGITLLFVISMVVLFLLMGTTFVVVSNDYYKSAVRRSRLSTNVVNNEALLDRAFYQLMREVPLADSSSPLRGHSILADQYGYGFKSQTAIAPTVGGGPFVNVTIDVNATDPSVFSRIRTPGLPVVLRDRPGFTPSSQYYDGLLNGRVFSVTSGALRGVSTRIVNCELVLGAATDGAQDRLTLTIPKGKHDWSQLTAGQSVLINGRDFSGIGAGDVNALDFNQATFDTFATNQVLGINSLAVNFKGTPFNTDDFNVAGYVGPANEMFVNLSTDAGGAVMRNTGFLAVDNGPNEPYDVADFQNMFLSGIDRAGNIIPSFHRDRLYSNRVTAPAAPSTLQQFTFRPVYVEQTGGGATDDGITFGSTANRDFYDSHLSTYFETDGTPRPLATPNSPNNLDVDTDGDGQLDSVWIDIGLPTQVDSMGVRFRPLVAYRVVDMDGRLNVNAHGSEIDALINSTVGPPINRLGNSYGVADLSLRNVVQDGAALVPAQDFYAELIDGRSPDIANNPSDVRYGLGQKLFGYTEGTIIGATQATLGGSFATASNLGGQFAIGSAIGSLDEMPGLIPVPGFASLPAGTEAVAYRKDFSLGGGTGSQFFEPWEMEALLRPFDSDSRLMASRLSNLIDLTKTDAVTTDSFEVNVPPVVISAGTRLNNILEANGVMALAARSTLIAGLLPHDLRLGGKLNINRPLGDGDDDGGIAGVVDDPAEVISMDQQPNQNGSPTMDLDNAGNGSTGDAAARYLLAKDIYITFLLACGDRAPAGFATTGTPPMFSEMFATIPGNGGEAGLTTADLEYRKMVAQFAVNVVDYKDADSIMTAFEFDLEPFDAGGWEVNGNPANSENDGLVVWGAERPELLLTESFAFHDRQTRDGPAGGDVAAGDLDWDSVNAPLSGAAFEIYNPWFSQTGMYAPPRELGPAGGINLGLQAGTSPVWRIALTRVRRDRITDVVRTIYFSDPTALGGAAGAGDQFFPSAAAGIIAPGAYVSILPTADPMVAGQTLTASTTAVAGSSIPAPRVVRIDSPRELSISDMNGGYVDLDGSVVQPGDPFAAPIDTPVDRNAQDLDGINTSGIADNFRYAYLQRLANPALAYNAATNPYISVDSITVDLLAGNSLGGTFDTVNGEVYDRDGAGAAVPVNNTKFDMKSTSRGETYGAVDLARKNLFASEDGLDESSTAGSTPVGPIIHTFGAINSTYAGGTVPLGCLTWNNRPYASAGEIANVPYLPSGLMTYFFNEGARPQGAIDPEIEVYHEHMMPFFGEIRDNSANPDGHRHLLRFSQPLGITTNIQNEIQGASAAMVTPTPMFNANRFARLFDYIETPSLYLGSETFLPTAGVSTGGTYPINFNPPYNFLPEFRTPGKININTIADDAEDVWNSINGGFSNVNFKSGGTRLLRRLRDNPLGPTDFAGFFTSTEGRMHIPPAATGMVPGKGSLGTAFTVDPANGNEFFDAVADPAHDVEGNAYFRNEFRNRLTNLTTTRSSVFAIWITIGYFEIDRQGRIGQEIGTDTGESSRDRAFFMIDRSIPVAFEPGRNHNIDQTILTRTIIE